MAVVSKDWVPRKATVVSQVGVGKSFRRETVELVPPSRSSGGLQRSSAGKRSGRSRIGTLDEGDAVGPGDTPRRREGLKRERERVLMKGVF